MGKKFLGLGGTDHFWDRAKAWILNQITSAVTAKIAEVVANAPEDLDTLKEIADWISAHANDAAAMNTQITENKNNTATNTSDISALKTSVAGKANKVHTHTKAQITDFPTSLKNPNALTVNGKTYDGSEAVDAGVQTVANGGTGATDAATAFNTLADGVRDSSTPVDNEKMLLKPAGTWCKTTCLDFWNYIKGKISSVLGLTKDNYGGKADTAGTADKATSDANGNNIVNTYATKTELEKTTTKTFDLNTVSSYTTKYIKLGTFHWYDNNSLICELYGDSFRDKVNINILNGHANSVSVCGYYSTNSMRTRSIIVKRGDRWSSNIEIYLQVTQVTTLSIDVTIDKNIQDRINISESTTAPSGTLEEIAFNNSNGMFSGNIDAICIKANNRMRIPIGAPSSLEDGCIWIER